MDTIGHVISQGTPTQIDSGLGSSLNQIAAAASSSPSLGGGSLHLSAEVRAIWNVINTVNNFANKNSFVSGLAGAAVWAGIQAVSKYGAQQFTNAISAIANAGSEGEQSAVTALNQASPGLGTAAQSVVNEIGAGAASSYNATVTSVDQIISEAGDVNWTAVFQEMPPP